MEAINTHVGVEIWINRWCHERWFRLIAPIVELVCRSALLNMGSGVLGEYLDEFDVFMKHWGSVRMVQNTWKMD